MVQQTAIYVGSTGPVFAPYWSARLALGCSKARTGSARACCTASEGTLSKTLAVHVRVHDILQIARAHTEPGERM